MAEKIEFTEEDLYQMYLETKTYEEIHNPVGTPANVFGQLLASAQARQAMNIKPEEIQP